MKPEDDALGRGAASTVECEPESGGTTLPAGFWAVVVADLVLDRASAAARHMAVTPSGVLSLAINSPRNVQPSFGILGLRDRDGDGRADEQSRFSPGLGGSGIAWVRLAARRSHPTRLLL